MANRMVFSVNELQPALSPNREIPSKGLSTSARTNMGWSRAFQRFSTLWVMPTATEGFECFWKYKKIPANVRSAWSGHIASVWFIFSPRQIGSRSSTTVLRRRQKPPSLMSSQWAVASFSSFCFFWRFFSAPTCAEIMSSLLEITARRMESFKSHRRSNAIKCVVQRVRLATRNASTLPGGTEISAWVSLNIDWTHPWLRIQPIKSVASSAVAAASSFTLKYSPRISWNWIYIVMSAVKEIPNAVDKTHLMCTTWRAKQPWSLQYKIFSPSLASTIVITAEGNNAHCINILSLINHALKCFTHWCSILLVCRGENQVNEICL